MSIFYVEALLSFIGLGLLISEIRTMKSVLWNSKTLTLIGFLISYLSLTLLRAWGIISENPTLRQYGPSVSGLSACIFLVLWGSEVMKLPKKNRWMYGIVSAVGILLFMVGRLSNIPLIQTFGASLTGLVIIAFVVTMFRYVFTESPYIRARQRIFLLSISFVFLAIFEVVGVYFMGQLEFNTAAAIFALILPIRFGFNLSIILPVWIAPFLKPLIN